MTSAILFDIDDIINLEKIMTYISPIPVKKKSVKMGCVFVIPDNVYIKIKDINRESRKEFINSNFFLKSIIKKGFIFFCDVKNVCELIDCYDCLTETINCVKPYIYRNTILWSKCSLKDKFLKKKLTNMILAGFTSPYICKNNPVTDSDMDEYSLCMYKNCQSDICPIIKMDNVIYVLNEFKKSMPYCSLELGFDFDTLEYLKKLPFLGKSKNKDGSISQKEIAGALYVDQTKHLLSIDKSSVKLGDEFEINIDNATFNFHSHPYDAYKKFSTKIGYPSSQDYAGFLDSYINTGTILHIVAAIEGIYVISINKEWVNEKSYLKSIRNKILKTHKIPFGTVSSEKDYLDLIYSLPTNVYDIVFYTWKDAVHNKVNVNFNRNGNNCFTDLEIIKIVKKLHK